MEARRRAGLVVLLAAACAKPGVPSVDLRAALLLVYPEYRGTRVTQAYAAVERKGPPLDGGLPPPFEHRGNSVVLPLSETDVARIFSHPR